MMHPVALGDEQLEIPRCGEVDPAPLLPQSEAVIGELIPIEIIVDDDVHRAVAQVLGRIGLERAA